MVYDDSRIYRVCAHRMREHFRQSDVQFGSNLGPTCKYSCCFYCIVFPFYLSFQESVLNAYTHSLGIIFVPLLILFITYMTGFSPTQFFTQKNYIWGVALL